MVVVIETVVVAIETVVVAIETVVVAIETVVVVIETVVEDYFTNFSLIPFYSTHEKETSMFSKRFLV